MPQKRNPVALEHARAIGSKALGQSQAIVTSVHNTPFGDIVDTEDDLQPLVFSMFRDAARMVKLVAAAMRTADFDPKRLEKTAGDGWTTLTELADTLVRDQGLPFKTAHAIASRLVAARHRSPGKTLSALLAEATTGVLDAPLSYTDRELETILSPRHFVNVRKTYGGPAAEETARATEASATHLNVDQAWWTGKMTALTDAEQRLAQRAQAL
jgi:argininosuccinate lyase